MNYIEPQKDKSFFTCPHCNIVSYMEYAKHHFQSDFALKKFMNILTIARCTLIPQHYSLTLFISA